MTIHTGYKLESPRSDLKVGDFVIDSLDGAVLRYCADGRLYNIETADPDMAREVRAALPLARAAVDALVDGPRMRLKGQLDAAIEWIEQQAINAMRQAELDETYEHFLAGTR